MALNDLYAKYGAQPVSTRVEPKLPQPETPQETIGPASDFDIALMKLGSSGRANPVKEFAGRALAYGLGFPGDIVQGAHNELFRDTEGAPATTEWLRRKLDLLGVTGQSELSEPMDFASSMVNPDAEAARLASYLTMPAHFGKIRELINLARSGSMSKDAIKARGLNFEGIENVLPEIEKFAKRVEKNKGMNTPFAAKSEGRSALVPNSFEKTPTFELSADCPLRSKYGQTICDLEKQLARVRPENPTLSSDELFNMAKAFHKKGETGPCLTCYVEAHRRSKADALQTYFDTSTPRLERSSQQIKQDIAKYLESNDVPGELALKQRTKKNGEPAFKTNKEGQKVPQLEFFSEYMDRLSGLKETDPGLAGEIDKLFAAAFRDRQPMRTAWIKSGAELPAEVRQNPAKFVNDPVYGPLAKEAESYSQAVSMAKAPTITNAEYSGNFLRMSQKSVDAYMQPAERGGDARGPRFSGSNDFVPDQLVDWFQALTDLSIRKMPAYTYTKDHRLAKIFGNSNMKINQSLAVRKNKNGEWVPDLVNGMPWEEAMKNRKKYPNVGNELTAKTDAQVLWGLDNPEIDVVIPGHYAGMSKEQVKSMGWQNNPGDLEKLREKFGHHPNFYKIVNDVRSPETIQPIVPNFNFDEATKAYNEYLKSGGFPEMHKANREIIEEGLRNVSEGKPAFAAGGYVYDPERIDDIVTKFFMKR